IFCTSRDLGYRIVVATERCAAAPGVGLLTTAANRWPAPRRGGAGGRFQPGSPGLVPTVVGPSFTAGRGRRDPASTTGLRTDELAGQSCSTNCGPGADDGQPSKNSRADDRIGLSGVEGIRRREDRVLGTRNREFGGQ